MSRRARSGGQAPSGRRQVGLTVPRHLKERMVEAATVLDWSVGDWVLAAAAEYGPRVPVTDGLTKRPRVPDAAFCALYLTPEERQELDDQATAHGLNRSAFVTASAQLALGASVDDVTAALEQGRTRAAPTGTAQAEDGPTDAEMRERSPARAPRRDETHTPGRDRISR